MKRRTAVTKAACTGLLLTLACVPAHAWAPTYFDLDELVLTVFLLIVAVVLGIAYWIGRAKGVLVATVVGGALLGVLALNLWMDVSETTSLNDWRRAAWQACEAEHAALPKIVETDSVLDTTAGLTRTQLIQLLAERSLTFVELKVAEVRGTPKVIFKEDCCNAGGSGWITADWAAAPYLKVKLGKASDPACRPELTSAHWKMPPFLPDTCLVAEEIQESTAAVRIEQRAAKQATPREWGWRQLVDAKAGTVLARLTSAEEQGIAGGGAGDRLTRPGDAPRSVDCFRPHGLLADLLQGPAAGIHASQKQVLSKVDVPASERLDSLLKRSDTWPRIRSTSEQGVYYRRDEDRRLFGAGDWSASVEGARQHANGIGPFGAEWIDLHAATLTALDLGGEASLKWRTLAALEGYFVIEREPAGRERLLMRFDRSGRFEWGAFLVQGDPATLGATSTGLAGALVDAHDLVLFRSGHIIQPGEAAPEGAHGLTYGIRYPLDRLAPKRGRPTSRADEPR